MHGHIVLTLPHVVDDLLLGLLELTIVFIPSSPLGFLRVNLFLLERLLRPLRPPLLLLEVTVHPKRWLSSASLRWILQDGIDALDLTLFLLRWGTFCVDNGRSGFHLSVISLFIFLINWLGFLLNLALFSLALFSLAEYD